MQAVIGLGGVSFLVLPSNGGVFERVEEALFHIGVIRVFDSMAEAEQQVRFGADFMLVEAEDFFEATFRLVAHHCVSYFSRCGNADPGTQNIRTVFSADACK